MSEHHVQVVDGVVSNVALFDGEPFAGWLSVEGLVPRPGIGWSYDGKAFTPPPQPAAGPRRVPGIALVKAAKGTKASARDLAVLAARPSVPEDADSVLRIAADDGRDVKAWFDLALGVEAA